MKIELKKITVRDLADGYQDNNEGGVVGYGGKLDIRPPYQREFIYKEKQRDAVINTIIKDYPLNVMYWSVREDGNFEVIDGQQRTISICQYVFGNFSYEKLYFHNQQTDYKEKILNYELMIYLCSGTDSEKLEWFKTINIAGVELTNQELLNAIYSGPWVTDAKRYFSKTGCAAYEVGSKYLSGTAIRQEYLETVIAWKNNKDVAGYMSQQQQKESADDLWLYFQEVMDWVQRIYPNYRKEMKGIAWGFLYNAFKDTKATPTNLEKNVARLMEDEDVSNKKGIYSYLLDKQEKHLNIRAFSNNQKIEAYERQKGICIKCNEHFEIEEMEADHITPWSRGGKTVPENCQMLCMGDNRIKSNK